MRKFLACVAIAALAVSGCRSDSSGAPNPPAGTPAPSPTPVPTPTATPTPPPTTFDGLARTPAIVSDDSSLYGRRVFQGIASVARTGSRIWAIWFGDTILHDTAGEGPGNFLILRYSDDFGLSWSNERYLVPPNRAQDRAFDPQLWAAPDGTLWIMYGQSGVAQKFDGQYGVWLSVVPDPLSAHPQILPGTRLTDGVPSVPFQIAGNWYMYANYWRLPVVALLPARAGRNLNRINVANRSLQYISKLPEGTGTTFDETTAIELRNGAILAQWRTISGVQQTRSRDGGFTWDTPGPFTAVVTDVSRHALQRTPSGRLMMVVNVGITSGQRTNLTILLSDDEGETWPYRLVIDNRRYVSYPDVTFDDAGNIYVIYDRERSTQIGTGAREIILAKISESSVLAGAGTAERRIVSKP